jgi:hypothetical protein
MEASYALLNLSPLLPPLLLQVQRPPSLVSILCC